MYRIWKNRPLHLILAGISCLVFLISCEAPLESEGAGSKPNENTRPKVLKMASTTEPRSLDPQKTNLVAGRRVVSALFQGLIDIDENGRLIPGMAQGWDVSEDGLHYTFTLRDAIWSDGVPVTAQDFIFSFHSLFGKQSESTFTPFYLVIKNARAVQNGDLPLEALGIRALNDKILRIDLEQPLPGLLGLLSHQSALPVPAHAIQRHGANWTDTDKIVVNGAFQLASWEKNGVIKLVRNDLFHDAENVALDEIHIHLAPNAAAALEGFQAGDFDVTDSFPDEQLATIQQTLPGTLRSEPQWATYWYVFNTDDAQLADPRVRQALSMAIDRERITSDVLSQSGSQPSYSLVPPAMPSYGEPNTPDWIVLDHAGRQELAMELLDAAGYSPENPLNIVVSFNTSEDHKRVMDAVRQDWEKIGAVIEADEADFQSHLDKLEAGNFQIGRRTWVASFDMPEYFLNLFLSHASTLNVGRYESQKFDDVMGQALNTSSLSARNMLLREAEAIALNDAVTAPIYSYVNQTLVQDYVGGWVDNPTSRHALRFLDVKRPETDEPGIAN